MLWGAFSVFNPDYANGLLNSFLNAVSAFLSGRSPMQSIGNVLTKMVFDHSLGDRGTWLTLRPAVTYLDMLPRPSVAEHLAHPIA